MGIAPGVPTPVEVDATDERKSVPEIQQPAPALTTEEMLALVAQGGSTERAYRITEAYEQVERVYNAALSVGVFSAAAASTNLHPR